MSRKDTLQKAYGNTPKELPDPFSWTDNLLPKKDKPFWVKSLFAKIFKKGKSDD